jgi:hypothetical protein
MILNLVQVRHDYLVGKTCLLYYHVGPLMIRVHFAEFELSGMGLKHLPLINIVLYFLSILTGITLGGESLSGRLRCLGFSLKGNGRC